MNFRMSLTRSKQPQTKAFEAVKIAYKDPVIVSELQFFSFFTSRIMPYLKSYQTAKPSIPFLNKYLEQMYKSLLQVTIKSEVLEKCKVGYKLLKIDLTDLNNHNEKNEIRVCCGAIFENYFKKRYYNSKRYQQISRRS